MAGHRRSRLLALSALGLAAFAVAVLVTHSGGAEGGTLRVDVDQALYFQDGSEVRMRGQQVGTVTDVGTRPGGGARLDLRLDEVAWPLPAGTRVRLHWASAIAYGGRYVELVPPKEPGGQMLGDGASVPAEATAPVELDEVFRAFDREGREDLRRTFETAGAALEGSEEPLRSSLRRAPSALEQARAVVDDLGADSRALRTLVSSSSRVAHAVAGSDPGVDPLIAGAAGTFAATRREAEALRSALESTPRTLQTARATLRRADGTLATVDQLGRHLAPGIDELQAITGPLDRVLTGVREVAPDATAALATARRGAPDITSLLDRTRDLLPMIESVADQAGQQTACIRPYAPEIAGLASTWTGFLAPTDTKDKMARINVPVFPFSNLTTMTPGEITSAFPQVRFAFPIPPGQIAGQPWFLPACGLGPETLDPAQDPEAR